MKIIAKLEDSCLEKVCKQLELNYEIAKKYNLKIPHFLCQKIYDFSIKSGISFTQKDLRLFKSNIMTLKYLNLSEKAFINAKLQLFRISNLFVSKSPTTSKSIP